MQSEALICKKKYWIQNKQETLFESKLVFPPHPGLKPHPQQYMKDHDMPINAGKFVKLYNYCCHGIIQLNSERRLDRAKEPLTWELNLHV